jgi:uncharacterized protein with PQ loop repeat
LLALHFFISGKASYDTPIRSTMNRFLLKEKGMAPDAKSSAGVSAQPDTIMRRLLGGMSIFTLLMTTPQVLTIWIGHHAAGVSIVSWSAYLISALLWFWFGLQQGDKNIYLPCVGWAILDGAIIVGALVYG